MARALLIHPADNVVIALEDIIEGAVVHFGETLENRQAIAKEAIPFAHKMAIESIDRGACVMKYGAPVGRAKTAIGTGAWVHNHNAESLYAPSAGGKS